MTKRKACSKAPAKRTRVNPLDRPPRAPRRPLGTGFDGGLDGWQSPYPHQNDLWETEVPLCRAVE